MTRTFFRIVATILICTAPMTLVAQSARRGIVLEDAPIFSQPSAVTPLRVAAAKTNLIVVSTQGPWLQVQFQDPQAGLRLGFIQARFVRIETDQTTDKAVDLSVPVSQPTNQAPPLAPRQPLVTSRIPNRVFLDFNRMSIFSAQGPDTFTATSLRFNQTATATATYPALNVVYGWDLSGAALIGRHAGIGLRWVIKTYQAPVPIAVRIPPPPTATAFATDTDVVLNGLDAKQHTFDFLALYSRNEPRWRAVVFGGPTYVQLTQTMVDTVLFGQTVTSGINRVSITGARLSETNGHTWGFNVGTDATYFFSRFIGVGAGLHVDYGRLKIADPLTGVDQPLQVGATTVLFGPRFRF